MLKTTLLKAATAAALTGGTGNVPANFNALGG